MSLSCQSDTHRDKPFAQCLLASPAPHTVFRQLRVVSLTPTKQRFSMAPSSNETFKYGSKFHNGRASADISEWEDDDVVTPIDAGEQVQICHPPDLEPQQIQSSKSMSLRSSKLSTAKIRRLRSRQRQKAQNAKAGISLITDMSVMRRTNHIVNYMRSPSAKAGKFVDAAALRALEGEPNSASVGNWNWLKKNNGRSPQSATPTSANRTKDQELSPEDRPIVIGISLNSTEMDGREISPQTATIVNLETPHPVPGRGQVAPAHNTGDVSSGMDSQRSVWSPDSPETVCSFNSSRAASSVYSQANVAMPTLQADSAPPVPALPANYKGTSHKKVLSIELRDSLDEDDIGTPCTLFEEDGGPSPQSRTKPQGQGLSPDSASSQSQGWWDHVVTPFMDKRMSFSIRKQRAESPGEIAKHGGWSGFDSKEKFPAAKTTSSCAPVRNQAPVVRTPTPRRIPEPGTNFMPKETTALKPVDWPIDAISGRPSPPQLPKIVVTRDSASDYPPPYSPPKRKESNAIRYRAVFPPGHPLHSQFPPSPRPASPGLGATMTSQSRNQVGNGPETASLRTNTPPLVAEPLPIRPAGTFVPQEHAHSATGRRNKVERQRRRHEKEEVIARRAGGFWRGRGCLPSTGCFGRTGREGRQRRRVWIAIWGCIVALVVLAIVLAIVLTRHHKPADVHSIWVNLTDFPPMPTGVLTVVGPDNTAAKSGCTEPTTLWSCFLPKDEQMSVVPYKSNQPTVIMQIQWDNGTSNAWKTPNGEPPPSISRRALGVAAFAMSKLQGRGSASSFDPSPSQPQFKDMWFLGETTDSIRSDQKAGEPAPFYISLLKSVNDTVNTPSLSRRGSSPDIGNTTFKVLVPPPDLEKDGTSVPAVMLPNPAQQPVRLYDRGLPTEHYGFYTYFKRTIFLKSVTIQNQTEDTIPLDKDGGCRKTEASHLVTWGDTRLLVQIWTQALNRNASSILKSDSSRGIGGTGELVRPGTMPYPVTVTLDTHGGDPNKKLVWDRPIDERLQVSKDSAQALINDMAVGGTWINRRGSGDAKFGGFDGGTGGCKCEWVNWV